MEAVKPTLDRKAADQMNLNVLKRMDPDIEEVRASFTDKYLIYTL